MTVYTIEDLIKQITGEIIEPDKIKTNELQVTGTSNFEDDVYIDENLEVLNVILFTRYGRDDEAHLEFKCDQFGSKQDRFGIGYWQDQAWFYGYDYIEQIQIGGATVSDLFIFDGLIETDADLELDSDLKVTGTSDFEDDVYIDENLEVNGLITENEKRLAKLRSDPIFNNVTNKTSKFDYYLEFDQSSNTQEVVVSNHSDLQLETFTIIIDFKYTGGSFSNFRYLFSSASNYGVRISEDFRIQAGFGYNSNEEMITSYNQIEEDKWHQAVFTFDPNKDPEMVIYIDGILDTTKQTNNTPDLDADDRVIGHVPDTLKGITGLDGFYGKIANVKLLDESLDEEEVKELYYNPDKILGSEVSYWNLNEGMFDTANDVISGHNGTIQNAEWGGGVKENLIVENDINVGGTIYADGDEVAIDGDEQPPEAHSSTHEAGGSDPIETLPVSAIKIVPSDNWRHKDDTLVAAESGENDWELQKFFTMDTDMGDVRTLINFRTTNSDYTAYAVLTVNGEPDNNPDWQSSTYSTDQTDFQTFEEDVGVTLEEGDELQLYLKTDTPSGDIGYAGSENFYIGYSWDFKRYVTLTAK